MRVSRCVWDVKCRRLLLVGRGGNDGGFCLLFSTLFALQARQRRRRWQRNESVGWYFSQGHVPSTVISTKIRQWLAIVPVSAALLRRWFFLPDTNIYMCTRRRQDANVRRVRASRFLCLDPDKRWIRSGRPVDSRSMNKCKKCSHRRTKDHRHEIPPRSELHRRSEFLLSWSF